ncbi:MAG: hypothetical protein WD274_13710 [Acidimicrobiia bacterium]
MSELNDDFYDQYVASRGAVAAPAQFKQIRSNGWVIASSSTLPITQLRFGSTEVGVLLGWAAEPKGTLVHRAEHLDVPDPSKSEFEEHLYELAGRWACLLTGERPAVYLDPTGSLALTYSPERGTVASTTTLHGFAEQADAGSRGRLAPNRFYPFGLTSRAGVTRLLPNHRLDLESFEVSRHWPTAPIRRDERTAEHVAVIEQSTRDVLATFASEYVLILPLTAGRDSRMVVSAAASLTEQSEFVTFDYPGARRGDVKYARYVARRWSLNHHVLPVSEASESVKERYLRLVGFDANEGKANDFHQAAGMLPTDRAWVTGFAGEVGRAYYWRPSNSGLTASDLLRRMHLPTAKEALAAAQEWLDGVRDQDDEAILDLLYIEQRLGCWASPQMYGAAPFAVNLTPLAQRRIFDAMLSLPTEYRAEQRLARDVARAGWPEMAELPFEGRPGAMGVFDRSHAGVRRFLKRNRRRAKKVLKLNRSR